MNPGAARQSRAASLGRVSRGQRPRQSLQLHSSRQSQDTLVPVPFLCLMLRAGIKTKCHAIPAALVFFLFVGFFLLSLQSSVKPHSTPQLKWFAAAKKIFSCFHTRSLTAPPPLPSLPCLSLPLSASLFVFESCSVCSVSCTWY